MARRVIEGQIGMFDEGEGDVGGHLFRHGFAVPPSPQGEGLKSEGEARVLTLAEIENLEPFRVVVWIEILDDGLGATTNPARAFLRLFQATFQTVGIPYKTERKHYHFSYTYTDDRKYYHWRIGEFYGQTWRVWDKCPTEAQRRETPWLSTK